MYTMNDTDIISLSSDSSSPPSPFINVSEIFNETKVDVDPSQINTSLCKLVTYRDNQTVDLLKKANSFFNETGNSPYKPRVLHTLSDSEGSETEKEPGSSLGTRLRSVSDEEYEKLRVRYGTSSTYNLKSSSCSKENIYNSILRPASPTLLTDSVISRNKPNETKFNKNCSKKTTTKRLGLTKQEREEEKQRKQKEKELKKAEKLASLELRKQMKPGNCIKFLTVILDDSLVSCPFGGVLLAAIQTSETKFVVSAQNVPMTVSWTRDLPGPSTKEEGDLILIWQWQMIIPAIKAHSLCSQVQEVQVFNPNKTVFLVVYGLSGYFRYLKTKRRKNVPDEHSCPAKKRKNSEEEYPYVTRIEIEEELIELQIMANCNHRLIESPEDLGQFILQITKSIAETPFKLEREKRVQENLEWFAVGDSRDCVAVDKNGNGLLRLWQQQLCQFNLASHDTAQAIASVYPSPLSLTQAYKKCSTQKEMEDLLKDIPVRRCQGPLSSSRRIGPELSKKIYTFFCSSAGDALLSQEC